MGPAIQGQGGDSHTYRAAVALTRGFSLTEKEALGLLVPWNETCVPPWTEADLAKKIRNAEKYALREPGYLLRDGRPGARPFESAEEALRVILNVLREPLDPDRTAREAAALGVTCTPTMESEVKDRKALLSWMLPAVVDALPWKRPPRSVGREARKKGRSRPDHRRIPSQERQVAVLAALGAFLSSESAQKDPDPVAWVLEQATREHFACHPAAGWRRTFPCEEGVLDALTSEAALDRLALSRRSEPGEVGLEDRARSGAPHIPIPEDPEAICDHKEQLAGFAQGLSPQERAVCQVGGLSEPASKVAAALHTTPKTVKAARYRIRKKAERWAAREA